jgi:DNA invertase Pin-like site-specific DNA recombinase
MKQSLARQKENILKAYPNAVIIDEQFTGRTIDRPAWNKLYKLALEQAEKGDDVTIVFDEISRMSRNADDGFRMYKQLYDAGIRLCFLKEKHLDTDLFKETQNEKIAKVGNDIADMYIDTTNKVLMLLAQKQIRSAFESAEWEAVTKSKNTSDGVRKAQAEGKQVGRMQGVKVETKKAKACKARIKELSKDFGGSNTDVEIMAILGIARNSYYKYKAELRNG